MTMKYPYSQPWITNDDRAAVAQVLDGTMLTRGKEASLLEKELESTFNVSHAVVCNSGTAALHLAYVAIGLGPGDELLTSPITFLSTANAAKMAGANVSFSDVDPTNGLMTPSRLKATLEISKGPIHTVVPVHLGGRACDMAGIKEVADTFGCNIIEDAAHAPGAGYRDSNNIDYLIGACMHSDALVFSFHAVKHIAMGEGGAILTNNSQIAKRARQLRNHALNRDSSDWLYPPEANAPWYYEMHELGWNYHIPDINCALGRSQLRRLEDSILKRENVSQIYQGLLGGHEEISLPPSIPEGYRHVWHLYAIAIDFTAIGKTRSMVMDELAQQGIGTQVHYIPLYHQPYYRQKRSTFPGAEKYYKQTLSIPLHPEISEEDAIYISDSIKAVINRRTKP